MSDKFMATAVLTHRATRRRPKNAAGFCRKFRFHRFGVLASDAYEARDIITAFAAGDWFSNKYNTSNAKICLSVVFPQGDDIRPVQRDEMYCHSSIVRAEAPARSASFRTLVAATSPEMAEWLAIESHYSRRVAGAKKNFHNDGFDTAESYVLPCPGDLVYMGLANLVEAKALFRRTYMELADEAGAIDSIGDPSRKEALEMLADLTEESKLCIPIEPTEAEIARAWTLEKSGDQSAKRMGDGSREGERMLASFIARLSTKLFQPHSHSCVGAGVSEITGKGIEKLSRACILRGANA